MSAATLQMPLPIDTVLFWVTFSVRADYERRGVFPAVRQTTARGMRAATFLHYLTPAEADAMLEDALVCVREARAGLRDAYAGTARALRLAIEEAHERPQLVQTPACVHRSGVSERWIGTKSGLQFLGIEDDGRVWPVGPGRGRWFSAPDSRGFKTSISHYSTLWPELFRAHVEINSATPIERPLQHREAADMHEVVHGVRLVEHQS